MLWLIPHGVNKGAIAKNLSCASRSCPHQLARVLEPENHDVRAGAAVPLPFPVHPHMLRHATGYKLANDGQDTRAIQHYLGHRNIQHTVRYTEMAPDRFKGFWKDKLGLTESRAGPLTNGFGRPPRPLLQTMVRRLSFCQSASRPVMQYKATWEAPMTENCYDCAQAHVLRKATTVLTCLWVVTRWPMVFACDEHVAAARVRMPTIGPTLAAADRPAACQHCPAPATTTYTPVTEGQWVMNACDEHATQRLSSPPPSWCDLVVWGSVFRSSTTTSSFDEGWRTLSDGRRIRLR
jgi:hypothetical protein